MALEARFGAVGAGALVSLAALTTLIGGGEEGGEAPRLRRSRVLLLLLMSSLSTTSIVSSSAADALRDELRLPREACSLTTGSADSFVEAIPFDLELLTAVSTSAGFWPLLD